MAPFTELSVTSRDDIGTAAAAAAVDSSSLLTDFTGRGGRGGGDSEVSASDSDAPLSVAALLDVTEVA